MDLDAPNHLGVESQLLEGRAAVKMIFDNVDQLQRVKREVSDVLRDNEHGRKEKGHGFELATDPAGYDHAAGNASSNRDDPLDSMSIDGGNGTTASGGSITISSRVWH